MKWWDEVFGGGVKAVKALGRIIGGLRRGGGAADEVADVVRAGERVIEGAQAARKPSTALVRRPSTSVVLRSRPGALAVPARPGALVPYRQPGALTPYRAADEVIDVREAGARAIDEIAAAADEIPEVASAAARAEDVAETPYQIFKRTRAGKKAAKEAKFIEAGLPVDRAERFATNLALRPGRTIAKTVAKYGLPAAAGIATFGLLRGQPQADMSDEELLSILGTIGGGLSPEEIVAQQRQSQEERIRQMYGGLSPELQAELDQQQAAYQQALTEIGANLATQLGAEYAGPISAAGAVGGAYAGGAEAARAAAETPAGTDVSMVTPVSGSAAVMPGAIAAAGPGAAGLESLMGTLSDQELARMVALGQLTGTQAAADLARDYATAQLGLRIQDERDMRSALLDLEKMYAEPELMAAQARSLGLSMLTPERLLEEARRAALEWESMDDTTRAAYAQRGITTAEQYITARVNQVAEAAGLGEQ